MRWWRHGHSDRDLDRELRSHLEWETAEQQANGLSSEEARYAAQLSAVRTATAHGHVLHMFSMLSTCRR
jgi:hypothetical protein